MPNGLADGCYVTNPISDDKTKNAEDKYFLGFAM